MWTQIFPFRVGHDVGVSWDSSGGRWWKAGPGEQDSHGCPDSRWCRAPRGPHSGLEAVSLWRPGSRSESRRPVSAGDLWGHSAPVCPQSLCGTSEVTDPAPLPCPNFPPGHFTSPPTPGLCAQGRHLPLHFLTIFSLGSPSPAGGLAPKGVIGPFGRWVDGASAGQGLCPRARGQNTLAAALKSRPFCLPVRPARKGRVWGPDGHREQMPLT